MRTDMTIQAEKFMQQAIEMAEKGVGRTAPNPPVGAVVVSGGTIVGKGYHPKAGQPHAEVFALRDAGESARGGDVYVTLEPCCHHGRTGPCVEALISAGVSRVYVGTVDPNPRVAGKGIERLRSAGVEVFCDVLADACRQLIAPFAKHVLRGEPYVLFKAAMTLDGQIATASGDSNWISSSDSRLLVHQLRNQVDAIMVGSGTVNSDNPQLTTRLSEGGRDPVRIIFDGSLATSPEAAVYTQSSDAQTLLVTADTWNDEALKPYLATGTEVISVRKNQDGLDLSAAMQLIAQRNLQHILLEGGSELGGAMMRAGLVDRVMIFIAPKILGGVGRNLLSGDGVSRIADAYELLNMQARQVGKDILIEGEVQYVHRPD